MSEQQYTVTPVTTKTGEDAYHLTPSEFNNRGDALNHAHWLIESLRCQVVMVYFQADHDHSPQLIDIITQYDERPVSATKTLALEALAVTR
jgi:hypothetical protein